MRRSRPRRLVAAVSVAGTALLTAACGGTSSPTVSDVAARQDLYEGDYLGKVLTLHGHVTDARGPTAFYLAGDKPGSALLVLTDRPVSVSKDQDVDVTGTVGQLHPSASSEKVPYVQEELYPDYSTDAYLFHARVDPRT